MMDETTLAGLRETLVEYQKKLNRLRTKTQEVEAAVAGIEAALRLGAGGRGARSSRSAMVGTVEAMLPDLPDHFTLRDVEERLRESDPGSETKRNTISAILSRMDGESIEVVQKGAGKRPTVYRRKEADSSHDVVGRVG